MNSQVKKAVKKRDISASHVSFARFPVSESPLWFRSRYRNWAVSLYNLIFVELVAKVNGQYYRGGLLMQELLPAICSIHWNCLSSSKTMHQHIALSTLSSFCAVLHPSSSVLILWPANSSDQNPVDYRICMGHDAGACVSSINSRNTDELRQRLAEDTGWISAECGGRCDWSMAKKTGNVCPCRRWSFWVLAVTLLAWNSSCHNRFFSEPPMPHKTTFGGKQCTFNQMNKFSISQGSVVTFFRRGEQVYSHGYSSSYSEITQMIRSAH